ncbi:MAG: phospho-sugar mutase, partial [Microthrixaceae bacterium]
SIRLEGPDARDRLDGITDSIVSSPPTSLGGQSVSNVSELASDVVRFDLADRTRVVLRPSGTEEKFKYYCEAIEPVDGSATPDDSRERAASRLGAIASDLRDQLG